MCDPITATIVGAAVVGGGVSYIQGNQARDAMREQMDQNKAMAEKQAKDQKDLVDSTAQKGRKANIDPATALYGSENKGAGSTTLTGPQGVDPSTLTLGKNSLLGA